MSKIVGKLIGLAVAAAGVYVIGKYLHDYTDFKPAGEEDLEGIRKGGSDMKDAVKRTYVAIRDKSDVKEPAQDIGNALGEMACGTGKLISTVGSNTADFVKSEKERYDLDPKAYRQEVADNFKDMGQQAVNTLNNLKEDAIDVAYDIKEAAGNLRYNAQDFVEAACTAKAEEEAPVEIEITLNELPEEAEPAEEKEEEKAEEKPAKAKKAAPKKKTAEDAKAEEKKEPAKAKKTVKKEQKKD